MTKRERLLKAFNFEAPDRVPLVDWVQHGGLAAKVSGREDRHDFWTIEESAGIAGEYLDMVQGLNASFPQTQAEIEDMDVIEDGAETWYISEAADGLRRKQNYWMGAIVERPFADRDAVVAFLKRKIEETGKHLSEMDWEEERRLHRQAVKTTNELTNGTELLLMTPNGGLGVDVLYSMIGWDYFCALLFDDPDIVNAFITQQALNDYTWIENVVEGADRQPIALIYCDIASTTGLMLSPEWLRNNMYANIERLASLYRDNGIRVLYHSEGNITRVIDDLISLGVEGINPLEKTVPEMSVPEIKKRWPGLVLWGGVDNRDLLVNGTVEDVRKEVEFLAANFGKDGGLLLGSSGQVHPGCRTENVIAMYETALSMQF